MLQDFFGGVTAFNLEQLRAVNGYGNRYWGWGREDDNMRERLKRSDMWPPDKPSVPKRSARFYFRHTQHRKALEVSLKALNLHKAVLRCQVCLVSMADS